MNKMEILKNTFEQIGYRTELEYDEDDKTYSLEIVDDDLHPSIFHFDQNYEPIVFTGDYLFSLDKFYKELDENSEED